MQRSILPLLLASSLALGGCVAGMAAGAVGAAVRASQSGREGDTALLMQPASEACHARASRLGRVAIIDVEQRSSGVIVWGTVDDGKERRSFECRFQDAKISAFKLRPIG